MKRCFLLLGAGLTAFFMIAAGPKPAHALTLTHMISFPENTFAVDETSGNHMDFSYAHILPEWDPREWVLTGGSLRLSHSGNLNDGPTREIWHLFTEGDAFVGVLSESESTRAEDDWVLDDTVIRQMGLASPWTLPCYLSEQTPYNSEKMELHESRLTVHYMRSAPAAPEPSSFLLLAGSILSLGWTAVRKRCSRQAG